MITHTLIRSSIKLPTSEDALESTTDQMVISFIDLTKNGKYTSVGAT